MMPASAALHGMDVLVTGGTGFLGSAFVRHAVGLGARVTLLARTSADEWRLTDVAGRYSVVRAALSDLAELRTVVAPGAVMVHFAAAGVNQATDDLPEMVATNISGTLIALRFAQRHQVSRFVLIGSSGEYGSGVHLTEMAPLRPTSEYGATRASATLVAQAFGARRDLDVVVVRPFAVYGPFEAPYRLIPHVILGALRGESVRLSSGNQTRDYVYVEDVASGIAQACAVGEARGGVFNLCTGVETTVLEASRLADELVGAGEHILVGALPPIPGEMWRTSGDPRRAHDVLQWVPRTNLLKGLTQTVGWFRDAAARLPAYSLRGS